MSLYVKMDFSHAVMVIALSEASSAMARKIVQMDLMKIHVVSLLLIFVTF